MKPIDRYHDLPSRNNSPLFEDQTTLNIKTKRLAGFGGRGSKCVCIYKYIRDMCVRLPTYSVYIYIIYICMIFIICIYIKYIYTVYVYVYVYVYV